jgi:hypothetical protein
MVVISSTMIRTDVAGWDGIDELIVRLLMRLVDNGAIVQPVSGAYLTRIV